MKDYQMRKQECPFCGARINRALDIMPDAPERGPRPGDLTICGKCEATLVWNAGMRLQLYDETNTDPQTKAGLVYARWLADKIKQL